MPAGHRFLVVALALLLAVPAVSVGGRAAPRTGDSSHTSAGTGDTGACCGAPCCAQRPAEAGPAPCCGPGEGGAQTVLVGACGCGPRPTDRASLGDSSPRVPVELTACVDDVAPVLERVMFASATPESVTRAPEPPPPRA